MPIKVKVSVPKRLAGEYRFESVKGFYQWMDGNLIRPKGLKADALLSLVEKGSYSRRLRGISVECSYDKPIGFRAKEIAKEIGFLKASIVGDKGYDLGKAYDFIETIECYEKALKG